MSQGRALLLRACQAAVQVGWGLIRGVCDTPPGCLAVSGGSQLSRCATNCRSDVVVSAVPHVPADADARGQQAARQLHSLCLPCTPSSAVCSQCVCVCL